MKYFTEDDIKVFCEKYKSSPNQPAHHKEYPNKCQRLLKHFNSMIDKLNELETKYKEQYPELNFDKQLKIRHNSSKLIPLSTEIQEGDLKKIQKECNIICDYFLNSERLYYL